MKTALVSAPDTTRVLFIGNSFCSQNNLPELFRLLAQGAGKPVVVASYMPGGISVGDTAQGSAAHMNNPWVYSLIQSDAWDFLVLQDNQGRFCLGYGHFPSSSRVVEGHIKLRDSLLFYHPCAHMIWFAGFGPKNGYPPYGNSGEALIDSIYQNYQWLKDTASQIMAPIGPAFLRVMSGWPGMDLWGTDATHPSIYGSYLAAAVIYSSIFKANPVRSSYNPGIQLNEDQYLKNTAFQTCLDSLTTTGLSEITPVVQVAGDTLTINTYANCIWFFEGNEVASGSGIFLMQQAGAYQGIAIDSNACSFKTLEYNYLLSEIHPNILEVPEKIEIFPNPAQEEINICLFHDADVQILDDQGKTCLEKKGINGEIRFNIQNFRKGMYFLHIREDNRILSRKFIKE